MLVAEDEPESIEVGAERVVVPWTELRDRPGAVGDNWVTSGFNNDEAELEGSISSRRLLAAEGSTRSLSTGTCVNDAGGSELDCTALALVGV